MKKIILFFVLCTALCASNSFAGTFWVSLLNWDVYVNNGVIYVSASNMPANCSYQRAQIDTTSSFPYSQQNNKDLYAYILSAKLTGKSSLAIVVDSSAATCAIWGAQ